MTCLISLVARQVHPIFVHLYTDSFVFGYFKSQAATVLNLHSKFHVKLLKNFFQTVSQGYFPCIYQINAVNQPWQRVISTTVCIGWVDNAAVVQAVSLIKHSAYANEKLLLSRLSRSLLYNEVDVDGSMYLI